MKFFKFVFCFVVLLSLFNQLQAVETETTVEDIQKSPGAFTGRVVIIKGIVEQWVESPTGTNYYLLKGQNGGIININSETKPKTWKEYQVKGYVQSDPVKRIPFIAEITRTLLEVDPEPIVIEEQTDNTVLYLALGALIIVLFILVFFYVSRKKQISSTPSQIQPISTSGQFHSPSSSSQDFKTIKITRADPKTMKFIPGKLEIISDEDKGKSFRIAGFPTAEGSIVTLGREAVKGEREYAHIQIDDKFKTVSRKQAEIREKDSKIFVKNLSSSNITQLNGKELAEGELVEIKFNDVIKMGELEFKYSK